MLGFFIFLLVEMSILDEELEQDEELEELEELEEPGKILLNSILEESKKKDLSYNEIQDIISEFNSSKL